MNDVPRIPDVPTPMPRWYCRCEATIVKEGSRESYGEPVAELGLIIAQDDAVKGSRNRHVKRQMPMGWNLGQTIPLGTKGIAEYIKRGSQSLWRFTAYDDRQLVIADSDYRKANFAFAVLMHYAAGEPGRHMPEYSEFQLTEAEHKEVMELIDGAVANTGGFILP